MSSDEATLYRQLRKRVSVSPLSEVLPQLLLLAKDLKHKELEQWTQLELRGYYAVNPAMTEETVLPEYRAVTGFWLDDLGRPLVIREDPDLSQMINSYRLRNGVAELEALSQANRIQTALDDSFPPIIRKHLNVEVTRFQFHSREVLGALAEIQARVIEWLDTIKDRVRQERGDISAPAVSDVRPSVATVFYSWQSDSSNRTNRGFIEDCLKRAIKELRAEATLQVDPSLDRDTKGVPGSPDISSTIFDKIESCALFVCDVSIINKGAPGRLTPNPNVLIELGFAVKTLGWNRVVCVLNEATGAVEELPFDLRHRRVRCYRLDEEQDKADPRKLLLGLLKSDLKAAFSFVEAGSDAAQTVAAKSLPTPRIEILDATLECQPPVVEPSQNYIHHIRPQFVQDRLVWTMTASLFLDSRPGDSLTVALHRCEAWMDDRYSGQAISLANIKLQSSPQSHISVDDAVLLIRGPGKVVFQGACETPFRQSGYPDMVRIHIRLPISEIQDKPMELTLELHETHNEGQWPLRWRQSPEDNG